MQGHGEGFFLCPAVRGAGEGPQQQRQRTPHASLEGHSIRHRKVRGGKDHL